MGDVRGQGEAFDMAKRVMRSTRLIGAVTPKNADSELARLDAAYARADATMPRWEYEPRDVAALEDALRTLARAADDWDEPARSLYSARIDEMALEVALVRSVGTPAFARLASRRFGDACALSPEWHDASASEPGELVSSDGADPRSLLSRIRAELGAHRAPFRVELVRNLGSLAATGERTVYVAAGRTLGARAARRIAIHEVRGHVLPRVRAATLHPIFALGTARGSDDQEGLALLHEERAELFDGARRAELSRRHFATTSMRAGADFAEVVRALTERGTRSSDAVQVAARVFRGSRGRTPGLGRESVYLTSFSRVRSHLAKHPHDERLIASGQVAVSALSALAQLGRRGSRRSSQQESLRVPSAR